MIKPSTLSVLLSLTLVSTSNWVYADQSLSGVTTISSSQPVVHAVTADVAQEFQRLRTRWAQNFLGDPNAPFDATLQKNGSKHEQQCTKTMDCNEYWSESPKPMG